METATLTLTEFLLARIAEDEAAATAIEYDAPDGYYAAFGWGYDVEGGDGRGPTYLTVDPARVLAECKAKREVIDGVSGWVMDNAIFRRLAVPYADHPDYRDEWRP